ncbi:hypothetical protein FOMPIDRAFT_1026460 [Fomitopsis schrenkii]|uniref:Uncharacterized protein n=1 Tax=Fomitopsis schrenkii TaxID=2126942 RepID=S8DLT6_FOMSC|nr:hypothetical protein FOMPIDRAFT_1026460 [Fomitopsis schrenkii]
MVSVKFAATVFAAVCAAFPVLAAPFAQPTDAAFLGPADSLEVFVPRARPTDAAFLTPTAVPRATA